MSNSIDKRIVEMQFDNKQFERGIQTSVKSLDKLKKGLDLEKSVKGLEEIDRVAKNIDLSRIAVAAESVAHRFSFMGNLVQNVYNRIGNAALGAARQVENFVRSMTIDPVKTGFAEYETQINSVQTILANTSAEMDAKGYSEQQRLDVINGKLDELNRYADKTIYNFTEMTRNIGTFTAAGVDLDTSVSSIQGIANLAAISGSTSQQASTAMYQLSQAISTGTVKLMDWNSVVNAGMGGKVFQDALIRTADNMGVVGNKAKAMFAKLKKGKVSFRESLASGWLSSDILTATLGQLSMDFEQIAKTNGLMLENGAADIEAAKNLMKSALMSEGYTSDEAQAIVNLAETATDAATKVKTLSQLFDTLKEAVQSGWTQTWEYIVGDFGEAKELLTSISDYFGNIIGKSAESRNAIMAEWKTLGGRNELINSFWNVVHSIENITGTVKGAFREFFPPMTGQQLFDMTKKVSDFTAKIKKATENTELMGKVSRVFKGAAAGLDILKTGAGWAWGGLKKLLGMSDGVANSLLNFAAGIGDSIVSIQNSIKQNKIFQGILTGLGNAATVVGTEVKKGLNAVGTFFVNLGKQILSSKALTAIGEWLNATIAKIPAGIAKIKELGTSIVKMVKNSKTLNNAWKNVKKFFQPAITGVQNFGKALWGAIRSFFGEDVDGTGSFWDKAKARFAAFGEKMREWLKQIKPQLEASWAKTKVSVSTFFTKTIPETFSALKIKAVKKWPWLEQVFNFVGQIGEKIGKFFEPAIKVIKDWGTKLWESIQKPLGDKRPETEKITFGDLMIEAINKGWGKIKQFFSTSVKGFLGFLQGINWGVLLKTALGIGSLIKIVSMMVGLSKLGSGMSSIGKGLKGIGESLEKASEGGLKFTKVFKKQDSLGTSLLKIAGAIAILVGSLYVLGNMEPEKGLQGLKMLGALAAGLVVVAALCKGIDVNGDALMKMALSLTFLLIPIHLLGNMDVEKAKKGILGLGAVLLELAIFMRLAGKGFRGKQSFLSLGIAINLLVLAVNNLGKLDTGALAKGIIGLGLVMLELGSLMKMAGDKKIKGMISMAIAMNLLARAVKKMGSLSMTTLGKGILGIGSMAAVFALIAKSAKGLSLGKAVTLLIGMAGSMLIFVEMFKQVQGMNFNDMLKFSGSISLVMVALAAAFKIISTIPIGGAFSGLGSFAILIAGVGGIVTALGWLQSEWGGLTDFLGRGGDVLGQIGTAIGKFIGGIGGGAVSGFTANLPQVGTDLSNFITNASGFIEGAKSIPPETLTGIKNLTGAVGAIAGSEFKSWLVSLFTGEDPITKFSGDIKTLGSALSAFAFSVLPVGIVPSAVLDRAVGIADSLAQIAGKLKPNTAAVTIFGLFSQESGFNDFGKNIKQLGSGLASFAFSVLPVGIVPSAVLDRAVGIADSLSQIANKLKPDTTAVTIFGLFSQESGFNDFGKNVEQLGSGLKSFAFSVLSIGTVPTAVLDRAVGIADALANIAIKLPPDETGIGFFGMISKVSGLGTFAKDVKTLGSALSAFAFSVLPTAMVPSAVLTRAVDIAESLADIAIALPPDETGIGFFGLISSVSGLGTFAKDVKTLGSALSAFAFSVLPTAMVPTAVLTRAVDIAGALADIAIKLPPTGGFLQLISGVHNLSAFADDVGALGRGLSKFVYEISQIDLKDYKAEKVDAALEVAGKIHEFETGLGNTGGLVQGIFGSKDLGLFAENVRKVGSALGSFVRDVTGVTIKGGAEDAVGALEIIRKFTNELEIDDGLFNDIAKFFTGSGTGTMLEYAENMAKVGTDLHTFSTEISSVQIGDVDKATEVVSKIGDFFDSLNSTTDEFGNDTQSSTWSKWKDFSSNYRNDVVNASGALATLGKAMSTLSEGVTNIDVINEKFGATSTFMTSTFPSFYEKVRDWGYDFDYTYNMQNLLQMVGDYGTNLSKLGDSLISVNVPDLKIVSDIIDSLIDIAKTSKKITPGDVAYVGTLLEEYGKLSIEGFVTGFSNSTNEMVLAVNGMLAQMASAVDEDSTVAAAGTRLSANAASAVSNTRYFWHSAGVNLGAGLANGISAMTGRVRAAASALAAGALAAVRLSWLVRSPSRAAAELGMYFDLGLANGLDQYAYRVEQSSTRLGDNVLTSAQAVLSRMGQVADGIDTQPTIRPVIDLTNVTNGLNTLDGMFSGTHVVNGSFFGGLSGMRSARALLEQQGEIRIQNGNRDVVDRLDRLSEQFDLLSEEMANMQIVLDSGVLVGQTSGKMDTQLGVMASRRRRGN